MPSPFPSLLLLVPTKSGITRPISIPASIAGLPADNLKSVEFKGLSDINGFVSAIRLCSILLFVPEFNIAWIEVACGA